MSNIESNNSQNGALEDYNKGPFKYYVIKEVGGCSGQMMMFDDKVGGWGQLNDDVSKKYTRKKAFFWNFHKKTPDTWDG